MNEMPVTSQAGRGCARQTKARILAWPGAAWQGGARPGTARQGKDFS